MNTMNHSLDPKQQKEYLVSQYLDGMLDQPQRREFERQLDTDPDLARLLQQYRALGVLLKESAGEVPELDWSGFQAEAGHRRESVQTRLPRMPAIFKLFTPLAAAAAIAITFTLLHNAPSDDAGSMVGREVQSMVVIARPVSAATRPTDVFVVYGCGPGDADEELRDSPPAPPIVAMAAVGGQVNWPSFAGMTSTQ